MSVSRSGWATLLTAYTQKLGAHRFRRDELTCCGRMSSLSVDVLVAALKNTRASLCTPSLLEAAIAGKSRLRKETLARRPWAENAYEGP